MIFLTVIPLLAVWFVRVLMAPAANLGAYFDVPSLLFVLGTIVCCAFLTGRAGDFFKSAFRAFKKDDLPQDEIAASLNAVSQVIMLCSVLEVLICAVTVVSLTATDRAAWGLSLAIIIVSVFYMSFALVILSVIRARLLEKISGAKNDANASNFSRALPFKICFAVLAIALPFAVCAFANALGGNKVFLIAKFPLRQIIFFVLLMLFALFTAGTSRGSSLTAIYLGFYIASIDSIKVFVHAEDVEQFKFLISDALSGIVVAAAFCTLFVAFDRSSNK